MNNFERTKPLVSVCIPSWFEPGQHGRHGENETFFIADKCLDRLVETIASYRDSVEIIIVDNGSTLEGTEEYFKKADIVIRNPFNLGFAPAMNQSLNMARGKYVIAMNNDILVIGNNWIDKLLEIFEKEFHPPVGLAMPNLIRKEYQKDCVGDNGKIDFNKVLQLKEEEVILRHSDKYDTSAEFGSMFVLKRSLLEKIREINGGYEVYNERFKVGFGEDRYLYHQVRKLGFETYRTNKLRVCHVGGMSMSKLKDKPGVRELIDENRKYLETLKNETK